MIYITGDVHGDLDIHKINTKKFPEQKKLTKQDYLIICGDFGSVWYRPEEKAYKSDVYWQKWYNSRKFTTLFVDGNHENHPLINSYPVIEYNGGKVHKISDSIYHLMRGEIYEIDGRTLFCFGGAKSHDIELRKEGVSWWPEEVASLKEMNYGIENLKKRNNVVDFIVTHCCSTNIQSKISQTFEKDSMTSYFQFISENVQFKHWYFGHYHTDIDLVESGKEYTCLYDKIMKI